VYRDSLALLDLPALRVLLDLLDLLDLPALKAIRVRSGHRVLRENRGL
jgi:hypothetical protein